MAKTLEPADKSFIEIFGFACGASRIAGRPVEFEQRSFFQLQMRSDRNLIRRHQYMYGSESDCCSSSRLHQYGARLVMIV